MRCGGLWVVNVAKCRSSEHAKANFLPVSSPFCPRFGPEYSPQRHKGHKELLFFVSFVPL